MRQIITVQTPLYLKRDNRKKSVKMFDKAFRDSNH